MPREQHCIILHGHQLSGPHMLDFEEAIRTRLGPAASARWTFHRPTFDYRRDFVGAAEEVRNQLDPLGAGRFADATTVFVTYSMGGLIARRLVGWGYACDALLSVSAPHGGVPWWSLGMKLVGHDAPGSLRRGSPDLDALNRDPRDLAHRRAYHVFGVVYRAGPWIIPNDGFLSYRSQTGIPGAASVHRIELAIREPERLLLPLVGVHGRLCHHPRAVAPMLDRAAEIMNALGRGETAPQSGFTLSRVDVPRLPRSAPAS